MPKYARHQTDYPGVWYIEGTALADKKTKESTKVERIYYIAYRKDGKIIEEKAGRQFEDRMTPAKASDLRSHKKSGGMDSNFVKRAKLKALKIAKANHPTIQFLFDNYLEYKGDTLKGIISDKNRFDNHLQKVFGNKTPEEIDPLAVDRLRKQLSKELAPATTRNVLELLRRIINFGFRMRLSQQLGFLIEMPKVLNERIEVLSDEQLEALYEAWNDYPDKHIVHRHKLIAWTGMRPSEIDRLEWTDIDFRHGVMTKRDTKPGKDKPLRMNETVTTILNEQRDLLDSETDMIKISVFVFPNSTGGKGRADSWTPKVKEFMKRAGITDFRPNYCLRDTIASTLLSNGATLEEVGYQIGHEPGSPMTKRYAKFVQGAPQRIVNHADKLMKSKFQPQNKVIHLQKRGY